MPLRGNLQEAVGTALATMRESLIMDIKTVQDKFDGTIVFGTSLRVTSVHQYSCRGRRGAADRKQREPLLRQCRSPRRDIDA